MTRAHPHAPYNLRSLTGEAWRQRIAGLPEHLRVAVASIVWWDFLSQRTRITADHALDCWVHLEPHQPENREELIHALRAIGYTKAWAFKRTHHQEQPRIGLKRDHGVYIKVYAA